MRLILPLAIVSSFFLPNTSSALSFSPHVDYAVGASPVFVAIADFNEDQHPDLAVVNEQSNSVTILLGNGDGTFSTGANLPVGLHPWHVAAADLNGDGHIDLAVANGDTAAVSVLMGRGDGSFDAQVEYPIGAGAISIAAGDVDGDGKLDLVLVTHLNWLVVLPGDGAGHFGQEIAYPGRDDPTDLVLTDLNGDGILDVATANYGTLHASESVFLGLSGGAFQARSDYKMGIWGLGIVSGDFDNDGHPDLAVSHEGFGWVDISLNNGDGTFRLLGQNVAPNAGVLDAADFNLDGDLDLVVPGRGDSSAAFVALGDGTGVFSPSTAFATGYAPYAATAGDLDGDHRPDIVTANNASNTVSVLLNTTPAVNVVPPPPSFTNALAFGFPNPAIETSSISYTTAQASHVVLSIYDVSGKLVKRIVNEAMPPGAHSATWNLENEAGQRVAAGIYLCELRTGMKQLTRRLAVVR